MTAEEPVMPLLSPLSTRVPAPFLSKDVAVPSDRFSSASVPLKVSVLVAATVMSVGVEASPW